MPRTPVLEAKLVETEGGLKPEGDGWFIVNIPEAMSMGVNDANYGFVFESAIGSSPHLGINIRVLGPGEPAAMYHAESGQEGFLVLHGEGVLIVEDEERPLRQWDFVHCPPSTAHVVVGAGDEPCVVLMVGARCGGSELVFPASEAAAKHGASVEQDTRDRAVAYAGWSRPTPRRYPWPL